MNRNIKRVAFALTISVSSFVGTVLWFNSGKKEKIVTDAQPIAILNESSNEVQRKPSGRLIWENVTKNDSLFTGEEIRTSNAAEAKITLLKSGTVINLEADSRVVLQENEKGMRLDFLEGNLFVQSATDNKALDAVTVSTTSGVVQLNSADLSLSREASGAVSMAVYKGQAELQQGNKKISIEKDSSATLSASGLIVDKDRIQVLWPQPGESVLLNLLRNEQLEVNFKSLDPGYSVRAEWGTARHQLKSEGEPVSGERGKILLGARSGKWFLRLVAQSEDPQRPVLTSNIFPFLIGPKATPTLIEPIGFQPVIKGHREGLILFAWVNRHAFKSQILEVASDKEFKNIKIKKIFKTQITKHEESLPEGSYYWRVTGFVESQGKMDALVSPSIAFKAQDQWELKPPQLLWPTHRQSFNYSAVQKEGLLLKWQAPSGVKKFSITVQKKNKDKWENFLESDVELGLLRLENPQPGSYQWRVSSWNLENGEKKDSAPWLFNVGEMPKVEWVESPLVYEYSTSKPTLQAQWQVVAADSYRYKVLVKGADIAAVEWQKTDKNYFVVDVPSDGSFAALVEAIDEQGRVLSQSDVRYFDVKKFLLLPPPQWTESTPKTFQADAKGNLAFAWEEVSGADHYIMTLQDDTGKIVDERKLASTTTSLKSLKPGQYQIHLKSVDGQKRIGDKENSKALIVPATSDINAPKFKSMKVQ